MIATGYLRGYMAKEAGDPDVERLYWATANAETGGGDYFARTKHRPEGGSSAYGPVQITNRLLADYWDRYRSKLKPHKQTVTRLLNQGNKFLRYGNEPDRPGYHKRYDYGGAGDFHRGPGDRKAYERLAKDMMKIMWRQKGGNVEGFMKGWRGKDKLETNDPRWKNRFLDIYGDVK